MTARIMPKRSGQRPVSIPARVGEHMGQARKSVSLTPLFTKRSRWGVLAVGLLLKPVSA